MFFRRKSIPSSLGVKQTKFGFEVAVLRPEWQDITVSFYFASGGCINNVDGIGVRRGEWHIVKEMEKIPMPSNEGGDCDYGSVLQTYGWFDTGVIHVSTGVNRDPRPFEFVFFLDSRSGRDLLSAVHNTMDERFKPPETQLSIAMTLRDDPDWFESEDKNALKSKWAEIRTSHGSW